MKPTISSEELAELILRNHSRIVIIDARGAADAYKNYLNCHLPNALFVDLETELSSKAMDPANGGRHPLPHPQQFVNLVTSLGIRSETTVVVYDDKNGANAAARFWWMMIGIGYRNTFVLDGGIAGWIRGGYAIETGPVLQNPAKEMYPSFAVEKGWLLPVANMSDVDHARQSPEKCVIDVREPFRFRGESEPIDLIAGHIPGARNFPYTENLNDEGCFLKPEQMKQRFDDIFSRYRPEDVIVHCGSGVTACHTLLSMEIAGYSGARLYAGSWSEWSRNSQPIATGSQ